MTVTLTITESEFLAALRTFLLGILPAGVEVVGTQDNRVPEPASPDYIVMTPTGRVRLATNTDTWDMANPAADTMHMAQPTQLNVQLDIHGPNGSDLAQRIATLTRDYYGCDNTDEGTIQPLYATDGTQAPFINGEGQFENRWTMTVALQATPIVSTPQQFAAIVTATIEPPGG